MRVAYSVFGAEPILFRAGNWFAHLRHDWDLSGRSAFLGALRKCFAFVRYDRRVPVEEGRLVAADTPGAKFVPLPGSNHVILLQDEAFAIAIRKIRKFTGVEADSWFCEKLEAVSAKVGAATK